MGLLSRFFAAPEVEEPDRWSPEAVGEVLRHFPIGTRILYAPETKRELRLESVLMGYSIDRHFLYARDEIVKETAGGRSLLRLRAEAPDLLLERVRNLYFVIPYQTRSEIDFRPLGRNEPEEKLVQKPVNDFERGNLLTLFCFSPYGRVPNIRALVRSTTTLAGGPYVNQRVVILDPLFTTLSFADKRRFYRMRTRIPAVLQIPGDGAAHEGTLEDFSERFVRVRCPSEEVVRAAAEGRRLVLTLDLAPGPGVVTLQGVVSRQRRDAFILELKSVLKDGRLSDFQLIDQIELKSALLQHPATEKPPRK
ncbi:MAG: PilZ domain-containing protein [Deltaproteobacteria bacterium]|nr:PilZ domain-containing protein [Deltaproteobacteria bacterium]